MLVPNDLSVCHDHYRVDPAVSLSKANSQLAIVFWFFVVAPKSIESPL